MSLHGEAPLAGSEVPEDDVLLLPHEDRAAVGRDGERLERGIGLEQDSLGPEVELGGQRVAVREDALADRIGARMRSRLYEMCRTGELFAPDFRREVRQSGRARA